ncbi:MAG: hypothetical protein JXQ73_25135 [Phycisphaerae bacterium]|nr:hypothetical protein [Phycisphaerae bacterium]
MASTTDNLSLPNTSQLSTALDVARTKTSQAWDPAVEKVAVMMVLYPAETTAALAQRMAEIQGRMNARRAEVELQRIEAAIEGRPGQRGSRCVG